jgi:hypothetical protein
MVPMPVTVAVACYDSDEEIEHDVKTLARGGFDMTRVSVIGRDGARQNAIALLHTGRAWFCGTRGPLWTTLSGILLGAALVLAPPGGELVIVGSLASVMVPALCGATELAAVLATLGIPREAALRYEQAIANQKFLLIVRGGAQSIRRARELLPRADFSTFDSP